MNSVKGWMKLLQQQEWKLFAVPRPEVVNQTSKTASTKCEDPQGNGTTGPLSSTTISSQNPDVISHESSTAQLVGNLMQTIDVDNPSGEVYKPSHSQHEAQQDSSTEYIDTGSIGSRSSTACLIAGLQKSIHVDNASIGTSLFGYDYIQPSGKDPKYRKGRLRGFVAGVLLVVLCFLVSAAVALGLYFSNDSTPPMKTTNHQIYESTVELNVKVNETYQAAMANDTSNEFLEFQKSFCNNLTQTLTQEVANLQNCSINNLSKGSIIVNSTLLIQSKKNLTQEDLLDVLQAGNTSVNDSPLDTDTISSMIQWGDQYVYNLKITKLESRVVFKQCAGGDNFDCSTESICRFLPLKDTYPSNCNKFQLCINNAGEDLQCADGLEFAYILSNDTIICTEPSNSTYCGLRRATYQIESSTAQLDTSTVQIHNSTVQIPASTDHIHSSTDQIYSSTDQIYSSTDHIHSSTDQINSSTDQIHSSTDQINSSTDQIYSSTDQIYSSTDQINRPTDGPFGNCSKQFPLFNNLSFECPRDGREHFIPRNDTFPHKCDTYTWCANGQSYQGFSPFGTYFVYSSDSAGPVFDLFFSNSTYCVQRQMYDDCLNGMG